MYEKTIPEHEWTKISHTFTLPAGTKTIRAMVRTSVKDRDLVRFDGVQLEAKNYDSPFTLTTLPSAKNLYHLGLNRTRGTMTVWFNTRVSGTTRHILANEGNNGAHLNAYIGTDNKVKVAVRNTSGTFVNLITTTETISPNQWKYLSLRWNYDGSTLNVALFLNNVRYTASTTDFKDFYRGTTALGSSINGTEALNGHLEQFSYSDVVLTDDDIIDIYEKGRSKNVYNIFDPSGRINKRTIFTGKTNYVTSFTYEAGVSGSTTTKVDTMNNNGKTISYDYYKDGNIKTITQNGKLITYKYNELNELIREDNQVLNKTIVYNYDGGGNLLNKKEYPYTTGTLGTPTKTVTYSYGDANWKDKLTAYDGKAISYDNIGNPKTYNGYTYNWEFGDQLASITGNGITSTFKYNDAGIRTQKTVNGVTTTYHLDGGLVTYETDGIDQIYFTYDGDDQLVSMNLNGEEYFYIRNIQGDIISLIDETGGEVVSYTYDTWGKVISISGTLASTVGEKNPYLYRGYRYDSETGLYYLQARYYNPEWGRFLNADNFGGDTGSLLSHNVFAYCMNNPVNLSDPSGHFIQFLIPVAILVVRVVSVAITIYSAYTACKNIYNAYQEGGTSAALRQSGTEALNLSFKEFTKPLRMINKSKKVIKDITSISSKGGTKSFETPINSGTSMPRDKATPNSIYEQLNPDGAVKSRAFYDHNGNQFNRQDFDHQHFDKKTKQYYQPHEHNYRYNDKGQPAGKSDGPLTPGYNNTPIK